MKIVITAKAESAAVRAVRAAIEKPGSFKRDFRTEKLISTNAAASFVYADRVLREPFYLDGKLIIANATEGRIQLILKTMRERLEEALKKDRSAKGYKVTDPVSLLQYLADKFDPTTKKTYLTALANHYAKGAFLVEDASKFNNGLKLFDKFKAKMKVKDFNSFKTMGDFWGEVAPFEEAKTGGEQIRELKESADVYLDTPNLKVIIPRTEAASCLYGANTKWCTAGDNDNLFEHYNSKGPLYILMFKNLGGKPRKFQLQYEDGGSFKNETDDDVTKKEIALMSEDAGYTKFLNMLIDLHYKDVISEVKEELNIKD